MDFGLGAPFGMSDQFVVSFLFIMAVVFGVLELTNLFKNRAVNLLIALAISAFASSQASFTSMLFGFLPSITWFFIVIFFIAFGFELFGVRKGNKDPTQSAAVAGGVLLILFSVGWMFSSLLPTDLPFIGNTGNLIFLVGLVLIVSLFWGVLGKSGGGKGKEG